jgi:hypothetical protein
VSVVVVVGAVHGVSMPVVKVVEVVTVRNGWVPSPGSVLVPVLGGLVVVPAVHRST